MPLSLNSNSTLFLLEKQQEGKPLRHFSSRVFEFKLNHNFTLLLNSLSGAIDILNKKELSSIQTIKDGSLKNQPELRQFLFNRRYLFVSQAEEDKYFKILCQSVSFPGMAFHIYVNSFCDFACPYCFEKERTKKYTHLDSEKLNQIFESISEIRQALNIPPNKVVIKIFGGEPLLPTTEKMVFKILQHCKDRYYSSTITTNGYNLDSFVEALAEYKELIPFLHISLDGPPRIHNKKRPLKNGGQTFDKIATNINLALDKGLRVLLRTNLDHEVLAHLRQLIKYYIRMGWYKKDNFMTQMSPVFDMFNSSSSKNIPPQSIYLQILPLLHYISKNFCHPPIGNFLGDYIASYLSKFLKIDTGYNEWPTENDFSFSPRVYACIANWLRELQFLQDGKIYPCVVVAGKSRYAIGKYLPTTKFFAKKCQNWKRRNIGNIRPCSRCNVATFCGGGCVISASENNQPSKNVLCGGFKKTLEDFLTIHRKRILKLTNGKN